MELKPTVMGTMLSLATVAFGLIAAGAWNKAISDLIGLFLKPGNGVIAELVYAALVTLLAIFVLTSFGRYAEREAERHKA